MFVQFEKWNACGNDFILVKRHLRDKPEWVDLFSRHAKQLCSRSGLGIGADGILLLTSNPDETHLSIINADGSLALNCGNGIRAAASSLFIDNSSKTNDDLDGCAFHIEGRSVSVQFLDSKRGGLPWAVATMPETRDVSAEYQIDDVGLALCATSIIDIGNRHAVLFCQDDLPEVSHIDEMSLKVQQKYPDLNLMWVIEQEVRAADSPGFKLESAFRAIPYERGVGRTGSCGSGACAVVDAFVRQGFSDKQKWSAVYMPGGSLYVSHSDPHQLTGQSHLTFRGEIDL